MRHLHAYAFTLSCLLLSLVFTGCASSPKVQQDFKSGTDFRGLKTYSWRSADVAISGANSAYIQGMMDDQLLLQGYIKVRENADMLLDLHGFTRASQGGNTSIGLGIGIPIGRHASIGLGTGQSLTKGKQEAVLMLDITHATTNNLIWRGSAEGLSLSYFKLNAESKLRGYIKALLAPFPPS